MVRCEPQRTGQHDSLQPAGRGLGRDRVADPGLIDVVQVKKEGGLLDARALPSRSRDLSHCGQNGLAHDDEALVGRLREDAARHSGTWTGAGVASPRSPVFRPGFVSTHLIPSRL